MARERDWGTAQTVDMSKTWLCSGRRSWVGIRWRRLDMAQTFSKTKSPSDAKAAKSRVQATRRMASATDRMLTLRESGLQGGDAHKKAEGQ